MRIFQLIILISVFMSCDNIGSKRIDKYYSSGNLMYSIVTVDSMFHGSLKYLNDSGDTLVQQNWNNGLTNSEIYNYDKALIDLFIDNMKVNLDSLLYEGQYHKLEIYNFPSYPLMFIFKNADAKKVDNHIYIRPNKNAKTVKTSVQIRVNGENREIISIERKVKKIIQDES